MNSGNAVQRAMAWYPIPDSIVKTLDEIIKYYSHELETNKINADYDKQFRISLALYELGVSVTP